MSSEARYYYRTTGDDVGCGHAHLNLTAARQCARERVTRTQECRVRVIMRYVNGAETVIETVESARV